MGLFWKGIIYVFFIWTILHLFGYFSFIKVLNKPPTHNFVDNNEDNIFDEQMINENS